MKHEITIDMEVELTVEVEFDITRDWSADERGVFHAGWCPDVKTADVTAIHLPGHAGSVGPSIYLPDGLPARAVKHYVEQHCFMDIFAAWSRQES